jgi:hypothetical protein
VGVKEAEGGEQGNAALHAERPSLAVPHPVPIVFVFVVVAVIVAIVLATAANLPAPRRVAAVATILTIPTTTTILTTP